MPTPPRRCAIVTVARLSKRLLNLMHTETYKMRHHAFPEMWPPTVALHHGLKAVYAPHPVYMAHNWPLDYLDRTFNHPATPGDSVFGWGEHNQQDLELLLQCWLFRRALATLARCARKQRGRHSCRGSGARADCVSGPRCFIPSSSSAAAAMGWTRHKKRPRSKRPRCEHPDR